MTETAQANKKKKRSIKVSVKKGARRVPKPENRHKNRGTRKLRIPLDFSYNP